MMVRRALLGSAAVALAWATWSLPGAPVALVAKPLATPQQNEFSLELSNPANHYHLGVPDFIVEPAGDPQLTAIAKTLADVIAADLDFEREYYVIDRARSASIPAAPAEALPIDQWTALGADAVVAGRVRRSGAVLDIEVRMMWIRADRRGKQAYGAGFPSCRPDNPRSCAHYIADDIHKNTRGLDGVARTKLTFVSTRDATRVTSRPSQTAGQAKEVYVSDYDGANQLRFTVNRQLNIAPSWSPVGNLLAYTSYMSNFPDIYIANLAEPGRGLVRPGGGTERISNFFPAWSPDGSKLAFASTRSGNGNFDIWVVNRDGTGLRQLTNSPADDSAPTWSPDGSQIAFTSDRAGVNQLYVMSADGTAQRVLVTDRVDRPSWSKLNFIAFDAGPENGPHNIAYYDLNTRQIKVLTDGRFDNEGPTVAPNGRHIAFVTTHWGKREIATIDLTGQYIRQITQAGENDWPNWGPIPK